MFGEKPCECEGEGWGPIVHVCALAKEPNPFKQLKKENNKVSKQTKIVKMNESRHMVITPVARLSFPQLFKARSFQDNEGQAKSFQCDLIFDEAQFKEEYKGKKKQTPSMKKAVLNAKIDQWGSDKAKWPKMPYPIFKNGDERVNKDGEPYAGYAGKFFVTAKCGEKYPPRIVDKFGKPIEEKEMYGGCYVRAQIVARPYAFGKNHGVRFLLLQVMKVDEGERFGGISDDVFDVSEDDVDSGFESEDDDNDDL